MTLNILTYETLPIYEQLCLEEGLLRANNENWVIINHGSPKAIVMGISARPEEVVDLALAKKNNIPFTVIFRQ